MRVRYLNPKTDFAFKRIFGSDESQAVLLDFLNGVLRLEPPHRIAELEILDPYQAPKIRGLKDTYLDVRARDEQGRRFIIEIQVLNVAGFEKRVLYNACKAYAGQLERGDGYVVLREVLALTITDFVMFPELPELTNAFLLRSEHGQLYSSDLELVFVELPKFTKTEAQLQTPQDRWLYFLKHAGELPAVPAALQTEPAFVAAFDRANRAGLTPEELEDQKRREMFIQDQRGALQLAIEQSLAQGKAEGLVEGQQGERNRIAQELLELIPDDELLATKVGLAVEEIRCLRARART